MKALLYGTVLQWRLEIRSRSLLITCYLVPLLFFLLMGGIFTAVMPEMKDTLIQTMTVMGVSMGAWIGYPPPLAETYASETRKVYQVNGAPRCLGLVTQFLSAWTHLLILCVILLLLAPAIFDAALPEDLAAFFGGLLIYTAGSLGLGSVLGLAVKSPSRLTMIAQLIFLPSLMLSGIMFPSAFLPDYFQKLGEIYPATWGYRLLLNGGLAWENLWYFAVLCVLAAGVLAVLLWRKREE